MTTAQNGKSIHLQVIRPVNHRRVGSDPNYEFRDPVLRGQILDEYIREIFPKTPIYKKSHSHKDLL